MEVSRIIMLAIIAEERYRLCVIICIFRVIIYRRHMISYAFAYKNVAKL